MMSNTNTNNNQQVLTAVTHGNGNVVTLATTGQCLQERETLLTLSLSSCSSGSEGKNRTTDRSGPSALTRSSFFYWVCDAVLH